jgi:hypothetical protein
LLRDEGFCCLFAEIIGFVVFLFGFYLVAFDFPMEI